MCVCVCVCDGCHWYVETRATHTHRRHPLHTLMNYVWGRCTLNSVNYFASLIGNTWASITLHKYTQISRSNMFHETRMLMLFSEVQVNSDQLKHNFWDLIHPTACYTTYWSPRATIYLECNAPLLGYVHRHSLMILAARIEIEIARETENCWFVQLISKVKVKWTIN